MNSFEDAEFYTPVQVAHKLQLTVITIYSYIKEHKLPAIKFGRNYRISINDFHRMNYRAASYAVSKHSITANLQTTLFAPGTLAHRSFLDF